MSLKMKSSQETFFVIIFALLFLQNISFPENNRDPDISLRLSTNLTEVKPSVIIILLYKDPLISMNTAEYHLNNS